MLRTKFIKLVLENSNKSLNQIVDIFSLPVIESILSGLDKSSEKPYIRYEHGSIHSLNMCCTYDVKQGNQFELFEFTYICPTTTQTKTTSSVDCSNGTYLPSRKRSSASCASTATQHGDIQERFKKEILWNIMQNSQRLDQLGYSDSRFCYVNTSTNKHKVFSSLFMDIDVNDLITKYTDVNHIEGYMKIFSPSAKIIHLSSLNYRHRLNLHNYIIVYFDIAKYHQSCFHQIFRTPYATHMEIIETALSNKNNENNKNLTKLLENLLCTEIMP